MILFCLHVGQIPLVHQVLVLWCLVSKCYALPRNVTSEDNQKLMLFAFFISPFILLSLWLNSKMLWHLATVMLVRILASKHQVGCGCQDGQVASLLVLWFLPTVRPQKCHDLCPLSVLWYFVKVKI